MKYILALDQGTTSSRAIIVNEEGQIVSLSRKKFRQHFPEPGLVEHDPIELFESQLTSVREALSAASLSANEIAGLGITNQRETTIVWDRKTSKPIANAIVWQDRRTAKICRNLRENGHEKIFQEKTGLLLDPYFSGTKLLWILENVKGARALAEKGELAFGTVDTWLIWKLTKGKVHVTDVTNASRTLFFNIHTLSWDDELLKILDIPKSLLPEVKGCSEIYGETELFQKPIPIAGIAGDQQAALFGQGCFEEGSAKITYGTGCFLLMQTGEKPILSKNRLLTTVAWQIGGKTCYALEGSVFNAGTVVEWFRESLDIIHTAEEIDRLASSVKDTKGVYFVPAFTGLGAPHWEPHVRGILLGLTRGVTKAHVARAALEGIAFQVYDVLTAMESDSEIEGNDFKVDGGLSGSDLLLQFQTDLFGKNVLRPQATETTALGAAYLAGLAVGYWKDLNEVEALWEPQKSFKPKMVKGEVLEHLKSWAKAIEIAIQSKDIR